MSADFSQDHFALFQLPRCFRIDSARLDSAWRTAAAAAHPDRFAAASDAEKRVALMQATRINEAYQTLKSPLARARYLLQLAGVDTAEETNTSMPPAFLMAQMEWRENIEDARHGKDTAALEALTRQLRSVDAPGWVLALNWLWAAGIVYSTLATRQHVLRDVLGGTALAGFMSWITGPARRRLILVGA